MESHAIGKKTRSLVTEAIFNVVFVSTSIGALMMVDW